MTTSDSVIEEVADSMRRNAGILSVNELAAIVNADEGRVRRWAREHPQEVRRLGSTFAFTLDAARALIAEFATKPDDETSDDDHAESALMRERERALKMRQERDAGERRIRRLESDLDQAQVSIAALVTRLAAMLADRQCRERWEQGRLVSESMDDWSALRKSVEP
jgi:hypothetical protein